MIMKIKTRKASKEDEKLFKVLDKKTQKIYSKFKKYYIGDPKVFVNKISRDYEPSGKFPAHVLKTVASIDLSEYDFGVCILRGGIPYSELFKVRGLPVVYILCGRRKKYSPKKRSDLRFNKDVDKKLKNIKGKKVLLIENNSPTGNTPLRVYEELKKAYKIKKPDLFLDYFLPDYDFIDKTKRGKIPKWLDKPFWKNEKRLNKFGKIYRASRFKVNEKEEKILKKDFLLKLS